MTIGIPRALLYYRYGALWKTFFEELGCRVVLSQKSDQRVISAGDALSDSECCLPVKAFAGHIASLVGRCDYIFAPRFERLGKHEEFCVRFWGLTDLARGTLPGAKILSHNLQSGRPGAGLRGFVGLGRALGKSKARSLWAYWLAVRAQREKDARDREKQRKLLAAPGLKVLVAAQPYISYDPAIGGPLVRLLREAGLTPIFAEACPRPAARQAAKKLTHSLYWTMNKEIVGALELLRPQIDGVILVSAFPCGTDCLVNELILRRVKGLPITQIILDGLHGQAGLQTRIECFADILKKRGRGHAG
ncbi:MAG: acyl-CoA dehydratase activase-related protein [Oscillospiraceae bacterium]|nr:acyl-CoA dehydratase activase-related protein [Oscillospiraceae bacterium]